MKRAGKILLSILLVFVMITSVSMTAFAHSGRTDSSGGHKDNKNKSGLGGYHYHCGGYPAHLHDDGYCPYTDVMPSRVSMDIEKTNLRIGENSSITATVSPSDACDTSVTWESSDSSVVTVSNGSIKAVGYGTATITATAANGKQDSVAITVKEVAAESVAIQEPLETMYIGGEYQLAATITPEDVDNPTIVWSSSDTSIATVDANGKLKAIAIGTVDISAEASNGINDVKTFSIEEVVAEKIEIQAESTVIHGDTIQAKALIYPENTTVQDITWKVNDPEIATIDKNGNIQGINVGKVTITAVQKDVSASFEIEVIPRAVEKIEIISPIEDGLEKGETAELSAIITPDNATYPQVYWESSDPNVISVDESGIVEAKALGTAVITAYTEDGCTATYELTVFISDEAAMAIFGGMGVMVVGGSVLTVKRIKRKLAKRKAN